MIIKALHQHLSSSFNYHLPKLSIVYISIIYLLTFTLLLLQYTFVATPAYRSYLPLSQLDLPAKLKFHYSFSHFVSCVCKLINDVDGVFKRNLIFSDLQFKIYKDQFFQN